jgi:hypothetical protein
VKDGPQREDIGTLIEVRVPSSLLGRHVEEGPDRRPRAGEATRVGAPSSDPEVEDLGVFCTAADEKQIGRLQIAMDDPLPVSFRERFGHAPGESQRLLDREDRPLEPGLEGLALEPLHREIGAALRVSVGDVPDDAGMRELRQQMGFALEPAKVVARPLLDELHCDGLSREPVARAKNHTHRALADLAFELEAVVQRDPLHRLLPRIPPFVRRGNAARPTPRPGGDARGTGLSSLS